MTGVAGSLAKDRDVRPIVQVPRGVNAALFIGPIAIGLALVLFFQLESGRKARLQTAKLPTSQAIIASPPPLILPVQYEAQQPTQYRSKLPVQPTPQAIFAPRYSTPAMKTRAIAPTTQVERPYVFRPEPLDPSAPIISPLLTAQQQSPVIAPRPSNTPALIFDGGVPVPRQPDSQKSANGQVSPLPIASSTAQLTSIKPRPASNRSLTIAAGSTLSAVLETAIDTAKPGMTRAIVSRDVKSADGRRTLIPRGSRLIGEYQSNVRSGQRRVLAIWNTAIRPDGVQIDLKSPSADDAGGSGIPGKYHGYFLERFSNALLQTALNIGTNLATRSIGNGSVIVSVPTAQTGEILGDALSRATQGPKLTVKAGTQIRVMVARELDFSGLRNSGQIIE